MNGNLVLWNWRKSTREVVISDVKNEEVYQSVFLGGLMGRSEGLCSWRMMAVCSNMIYWLLKHIGDVFCHQLRTRIGKYT